MSKVNPYAAPQPNAENPVEEGEVEIPGPHNYASIGTRFLGFLVDLMVMVGVGLVVGFTIGIAAPSMLKSDLTVTSLVLIAYIAIQYHFWNTRAQSIGKIATGTRIVMLSGAKPSISNLVFKRYGMITILGLLPFVGWILSLVDALCVFREDRNCLHDDFAETRVMMIKKKVTS